MHCTTRCNREDVLAFAYQYWKANGGAAGADGQSFENIERYWVEPWRDKLARELKGQTYRPLPVRRDYILKAAGEQRPLGISAANSEPGGGNAAVLVHEPIFEADLPPEQYAYRRDRGPLPLSSITLHL